MIGVDLSIERGWSGSLDGENDQEVVGGSGIRSDSLDSWQVVGLIARGTFRLNRGVLFDH